MLKPVWPLGLLTSTAGGQAKNSIFSPPTTAPNTRSTPTHQIAAPTDLVASSQTSTTSDSGNRTAESPKSVRNFIVRRDWSLGRRLAERPSKPHDIGQHDERDHDLGARLDIFGDQLVILAEAIAGIGQT